MFIARSIPLFTFALSAFAAPLIDVAHDSFTSKQSLDGSKAIISANRIDDVFADSGALLIERESHMVFAVEVIDTKDTGLELQVNGVPLNLEVQSDSIPAGPIQIETMSIPMTESTALTPETFKSLTQTLPRGLVSAELFGAVRILSDNLRRVTLVIKVVEVDSNTAHGYMASVMDLLVYKPSNGEPAHFRKYTAHKCGDKKPAHPQIEEAKKVAQCMGSRLRKFFQNFQAFLAEGTLSAYAVLAMIASSLGLLAYIVKVLVFHRYEEDSEYEQIDQYGDMEDSDFKQPISVVASDEKAPLYRP